MIAVELPSTMIARIALAMSATPRRPGWGSGVRSG